MDIIKNVKTIDLLKFEVGQVYYIKYSETKASEYLVICTARTKERADFLILYSFSHPVDTPFLMIDDILDPRATDIIVKRCGIIRDGDKPVEVALGVPLPLNIYCELGDS